MSRSFLFVHGVALVSLVISINSVATVSAQDSGLTTLEEVVVVGSRRQQPRSVTDSPVPVDVIPAEQFNRGGNLADATDNLLSTVPSFNATTASGDSDSFSRPVALRGMAQDQILLMVNGKRRHRSSVITEFAPAAGAGAQGPNIGMIPPIAAESVEVLRDGASAQYGADAIAGVINFRLKDDAEGGLIRLHYGQFYEGELSTRVEGNVGLPLGANGFVNLSVDIADNEGLSRGFQRPNAQTLIDQGVMGVGADSPFGDGLVQTWGRPETRNLLFFVNAGYALSETTDAYMHGNYADTTGRFRFFYRHPDHATRTKWLDKYPKDPERGYMGPILETGYTPYLDGEQSDMSLVGGLRGRLPGALSYDFSAAIGSNALDHFLHNAVSYAIQPTADDIGKRSFFVGSYEQEEVNLNADITKLLTESLHLAFGAEWRQETWDIGAGEPDSYSGEYSRPPGDFVHRGTSPAGMLGFRPEDAGSWSRNNIALYAELEQDATDRLFLQYALRYEDYSDFGDVLIGKLATRYHATDSLVLRGSVSTGFHAPTPGQSNFQRETTTFNCGQAGSGFKGDCVLTTVTPDDPSAIELGGGPLKQEESLNVSLGTGFKLGNLGNITLDFYRIDVEDRIYKITPGGEYFDLAGLPTETGSEATLFLGTSFFTNVLDIRSSGLDLVLTRDVDWTDEVRSNFTFAYNYNDVTVTGQDRINGHTVVNDSNVAKIEHSYPQSRFVLGVNTSFRNWDFLVRANYFGKHYDVDQGDITQGTSSPIDPVVFLDVELGYALTDSLRIVAGASNIFDEYVNRVDKDRYSNRHSSGLPYPRRAASNFEGGSWYVRTSYTF